MHKPKLRGPLTFIFITVLIDVIGIGIIIPVLPTLIEKLSGEGLSEASRIGGWLMFTYAIMQFLFAPLLGAMSDKYGRRPIILIALLGLGIDYIFHALAPTIGWLFVGRVLAGITGASFTVATAYIADVSSPEKKAQNFGLVGAAFGLGFIIGPIIGGVAAKWGVQMPFFVAAALSILNFCYGLFILPESLKPEKRQKQIEWKKANPVGGLLNLKQFPEVIGFIVPYFLIFIAGYSVQATWTFFTMYRFHWTEELVGYSLAAVGLVIAVVQGGLIKWIVARLGEKKTIILGMLCWTAGLLLFSVASESWMMFVFIVPYCLGGIASPTLQGIMSNFVPDTMQGRLQGTLTSLMSFTAILGPPLMTWIFYKFTGSNAIIEFPGAPFLAAAMIMFISLVITATRLKKIPER